MPVMVALSGLPGVGKSAVARALAARTGALWLRIDAIEQALRDSFLRTDDIADGGYAAARAVAEGALGQGIDVIADGVNPLALTREAWRAAAGNAGARCIDVELVCGDRAEHRRRVETRHAEVAGLSLPTWAEVEARDYEAWTAPVLRIDTAAVGPEDVATRIAQRMEGTG
ncbi:AAA family ATPase [Salipiger mucosus]|uniref:Kinase n=1 Tax=Salipiger mucosus DSM 16094 TaxID=1123237 RepID=S9QG92_9RHOB|nr:AAA family ATPase [Salipiger mucosus]EPX80451.1 hypothetical protein Salmuc_03767 [Salipiger mucosus DSM 16094]